MPALDDYGRQVAEEALERLRSEYRRIYAQAAREMREKQAKALKRFESEKSQRLAALDDTPEAMKAYKAWLSGQAANQAWMQGMVSELSERAVKANESAVAALLDELPGVYAESANWAAYGIEKGVKARTAFTLVDEDTVRNLITGKGSKAAVAGRLLPEVTIPKVDRPKDYRWNRQKFTSAITQGILQGESIPNIVKRTDSVFGMNQAASYRAVRTAVTSAESAGRMSAMQRAEDMGIIVNKKWLSAHDGRVRDAHAALDGQEVPWNEPFESELGPIDYPGDPAADPANVWNCRCAVKQEPAGFKPLAESFERWMERNPDIGYEEWKADAAERTRRMAGSSSKWPAAPQPMADVDYARIKAKAESIGVELNGFRGAAIDPAALDLAVDSMGEVINVFPELVKGQKKGALVLQHIEFLESATYAVTSGSKGHVITLNTAALRSLSALEADYTDGVLNGDFVKGTTVKAIFYHELGHTYAAVNKISPLRIARVIIKSKDKVAVARFLKKNLSKYAASYDNGQEIISEVFAAWFSGADNKFANAFMEDLLRLRGK